MVHEILTDLTRRLKKMKKAIQKLRLHVSFYMRKFPFILLILLIVQCTSNSHVHRALDSAYQLMNHHPDSALAILDSLEPSSRNFSQENLRQWQLLRLMAQNKSDTVFRSDSLQHVLVDYYDQHGTPNEKMWAYYLLGRAYYDMGEAPRAIEAYYSAAAKADTTLADCDFWNLARVYFNLANTLYYQNLGRDLLYILDDARQVASKARDTASVILTHEYKAMAYERLGKRDSMALAGLVASQLFHDYGNEVMAARALAWTIPYCVEEGNYALAKKYMDIYECRSGFFDSLRHVGKGKEHYYAIKGRYYLGVHALDSAEYFFRACMAAGSAREKSVTRKDHNCMHAATKGLAELYKVKAMKDSVVKYACLSEDYNDSLHARSNMQEVFRTSLLLDYKRKNDEKEALVSELRKSNDANVIFSILALTLLGVSILMGAMLSRAYRARQRGYHEEIKDYRQKVTHGEMRHQEMEHRLQHAHNELANKNEEVDRLKEKETQLQGTIQRMKKEMQENRNMDERMMLSDVFEDLEGMAQKGMSVDEDTWSRLDHLFLREHPLFYSKIHELEQITLTEIRICELVRLRFKPSVIAALMDCEKSNISNIRAKIYRKFFGTDGSGKMLDEYLLSI